MKEQTASSKSQGTQKTQFLVVDNLDGGWSTRSFPHRLKDGQLSVLDNFMHLRDNIWTIRPGNINYAGAAGTTGSGQKSLSGVRFYFGSPVLGQLLVQSNGSLYKGNDSTGAFTSVVTGMSTAQAASYAQMYDPDNAVGAATTLFICDGTRAPQYYDGTNTGTVKTTAGFLPTGDISGLPIRPLYVTDWNYHLVYANENTDPCALWISDALRPERFTSTALTDSTGKNYFAYYPGGRNSKLGVITGLAVYGTTLIIFFTTGIVTCVNTGTYGTFQFVFTRISPTLGCPAPRSIVVMDQGVVFFGGDRFYVTDGSYVVPVPDELPTLYNNDNVAQAAPEISDPTSVSGARRGLAYFASYKSSSGLGYNDRAVIFDTQGNGGWQWLQGTGGVWSRIPTGMPFNWMVECRGPGDTGTYPTFWGNANADQIASFDPSNTPTFTDFGLPISFELRTKAFFLDRPIHPKILEGVWPIMVFNAIASQFTVTVAPYAVFDSGGAFNFNAVSFTTPPVGTAYGAAVYGSFLYASGTTISQQTLKSYPNNAPRYPKGNSVQLGISGSAANSFNVIGIVAELIVDEPEK